MNFSDYFLFWEWTIGSSKETAERLKHLKFQNFLLKALSSNWIITFFCIKLIIFGLFCIFIFSWQSDSSADGFYFILISWNIIIAYAFAFPSDFPASLQHMKSLIWLNIKGAICPQSAIRSAAFAKIWKPAVTQSLTDCWKWSCRWYTD